MLSRRFTIMRNYFFADIYPPLFYMADNKARPKITGNHSFEIMFADKIQKPDPRVISLLLNADV